MTRITAPIFACIFFAFGQTSFGEVPRVFTLHGTLSTEDGPTPHGAALLTARIYDSAESVTPLHSETDPIALSSNGTFTTSIGDSSPLTLPFDRPYFLGLSVDGAAELLPRLPLLASPFSIRAAVADQLGTILASEVSLRDGSHPPTSDTPWAGNRITDLGWPENPTDATSRRYVDDRISDILLYLDRLNLQRPSSIPFPPLNPEDLAEVVGTTTSDPNDQGDQEPTPSPEGFRQVTITGSVRVSRFPSLYNLSMLNFEIPEHPSQEVSGGFTGPEGMFSVTAELPEASESQIISLRLSGSNLLPLEVLNIALSPGTASIELPSELVLDAVTVALLGTILDSSGNLPSDAGQLPDSVTIAETGQRANILNGTWTIPEVPVVDQLFGPAELHLQVRVFNPTPEGGGPGQLEQAELTIQPISDGSSSPVYTVQTIHTR